MSYNQRYLSWCTSILQIPNFSLSRIIYYNRWYRGKLKIENCSTWIHVEGWVYMFSMLMRCSRFYWWTFYPAEGMVLSIGENTYYGLPIASDTSDQPHTKLRVVPCQQYSHLEPTILAWIFIMLYPLWWFVTEIFSVTWRCIPKGRGCALPSLMGWG